MLLYLHLDEMQRNPWMVESIIRAARDVLADFSSKGIYILPVCSGTSNEEVLSIMRPMLDVTSYKPLIYYAAYLRSQTNNLLLSGLSVALKVKQDYSDYVAPLSDICVHVEVFPLTLIAITWCTYHHYLWKTNPS